LCSDNPPQRFTRSPPIKNPRTGEPERGPATEERAKLQAAVCNMGGRDLQYYPHLFGVGYGNGFDPLPYFRTTSHSLTQSGLLCAWCALPSPTGSGYSATTL